MDFSKVLEKSYGIARVGFVDTSTRNTVNQPMDATTKRCWAGRVELWLLELELGFARFATRNMILPKMLNVVRHHTKAGAGRAEHG